MGNCFQKGKGTFEAQEYENNEMYQKGSYSSYPAIHTNSGRSMAVVYNEQTLSTASARRSSLIASEIKTILTDQELFSREAIRVAHQFWYDNVMVLSTERRHDIGVTLYSQMFRKMPECRKIFLRNDIESTSEKFISMVGWLIIELHNANTQVWQKVQFLGQNHKKWGITYEHYLPMLQAFHLTFQEQFPKLYTLRIKFCIENLFMNAAKIMTEKDFVTLFADRVQDLSTLEFLDSLDACLAHNTGREYFERYLEQTFCAEYVSFLRAFDEFKQIGNTQQRYDKAKEIYNSNFDINAEAPIDFTSNTQRENVILLKNELDKYQNSLNDTESEESYSLSEHLLDALYADVKQIIEENSWDKFHASIYSIKQAVRVKSYTYGENRRQPTTLSLNDHDDEKTHNIIHAENNDNIGTEQKHNDLINPQTEHEEVILDEEIISDIQQIFDEEMANIQSMFNNVAVNASNTENGRNGRNNHNNASDNQQRILLDEATEMDINNIFDEEMLAIQSMFNNTKSKIVSCTTTPSNTGGNSNKNNGNCNDKKEQSSQQSNNNSNNNPNGSVSQGSGGDGNGNGRRDRNNDDKKKQDNNDINEEDDEDDEQDEDDKKNEDSDEDNNIEKCNLNPNAAKFNPLSILPTIYEQPQSIQSAPNPDTHTYAKQNTNTKQSATKNRKKKTKSNDRYLSNQYMYMERHGNCATYNPSKEILADGNIQISRQFTAKIPALIDEHVTGIYDYINVNTALQRKYEYNNGEIRILNYDWHAMDRKDKLYCVAIRQDEAVNRGFKWKMQHKLCTADEIKSIYNIPSNELPHSIRQTKAFQFSINSEHIVEIHKTIQTKNFMMTKWNKLPIYSKNPKNRNCRTELRLTVQQFNKKIVPKTNKKIVPILMFRNDKPCVQYIWIVSMMDMNSSSDMGIAFEYNSQTKRVEPVGIHLDEQSMITNHQLLCPQNSMDDLNDFQSNYEDIQIGDVDANENTIKHMKQEIIYLKEMNRTLKKTHEEKDRKIKEKDAEIMKLKEMMQCKQMSHTDLSMSYVAELSTSESITSTLSATSNQS